MIDLLWWWKKKPKDNSGPLHPFDPSWGTCRYICNDKVSDYYVRWSCWKWYPWVVGSPDRKVSEMMLCPICLRKVVMAADEINQEQRADAI